VLEPCRCGLDEPVGQLLGHVGREERRMRVRQLLHLPLDRVDHALVAVAETRYGRAAARVDIAFAGRIDDLDAVACDGDGQGGARSAMKTVVMRCLMDQDARGACPDGTMRVAKRCVPC
jgi:hypothetical protein